MFKQYILQNLIFPNQEFIDQVKNLSSSGSKDKDIIPPNMYFNCSDDVHYNSVDKQMLFPTKNGGGQPTHYLTV